MTKNSLNSVSSNDILVGRFWTHVVNKASSSAVRVKNPSTERVTYHTMAPTGFGGGAISIDPPKCVDITWGQAGFIVAEIAARLLDEKVRRDDCVAMLPGNSPESVWTDMAIQSLGAISVKIYSNNGADQVLFTAHNAGARLLIADGKAQASKTAGDTSLTTLTFDDVTAGSKHYQLAVKGRKDGIEYLMTGDREAVLKLSPKAQAIYDHLTGLKGGEVFMEATAPGVAPVGVTRADTSRLIYTSGSSGVPKGVEITQGNVAASCEAVYKHGFNFGDDDLYLSCLPSAHVLEDVNGMGNCIWNGVTVVFCKVEEIGKMLPILQPTIFLAVPLLWRRIKDKIQTELDKARGFKAKLIKWAFAQKKGTFKHWLADRLVFANVRKSLGGHLRILGSGGAPLSPDVLQFFSAVGLEIVEAYGLTETTGMIVGNLPGKCEIGTVGVAIDGCEIKIVPYEGCNEGQGEIWLRGPVVSPGYWKLPAENAEAFTADGWFRTGDVGYVDTTGRLHITDRIKDLMKNEGGKYIAPAKITKAFDNAQIIMAIVPIGDKRPVVAALVFVNPQYAKELLRTNEVAIPEGDAATQQAFYAGHALVKAAVAEAVKTANTQLESWEQVKKVDIIEDLPTVDNGLLTASQKVRRPEVIKRYPERIEALFVKPGKSN